MNTNSWSLNELVKLHAKAKCDLQALPTAQRARFYQAAQQRRVSTWPIFTSEAKDTCALLEYINSLPTFSPTPQSSPNTNRSAIPSEGSPRG
jgi:hypothetical protein